MIPCRAIGDGAVIGAQIPNVQPASSASLVLGLDTLAGAGRHGAAEQAFRDFVVRPIVLSR